VSLILPAPRCTFYRAPPVTPPIYQSQLSPPPETWEPAWGQNEGESTWPCSYLQLEMFGTAHRCLLYLQ